MLKLALNRAERAFVDQSRLDQYPASLRASIVEQARRSSSCPTPVQAYSAPTCTSVRPISAAAWRRPPVRSHRSRCLPRNRLAAAPRGLLSGSSVNTATLPDGNSWRRPLTSGFASSWLFQPYSLCMSKIRLTATFSLTDARQQHAREEGLARAALAEHAARSFHQPFEVEIDADAVHVQRLADVEVTGLFFAEDLIHILGGRLDHAREVAGHGLDGLGLGPRLLPASTSARHAAARRCWCRSSRRA